MESFLPSEVGRLIYGYLSESNGELADLFLNSSSVMEECRISKNKSRRFSAKVQGLTLVNILDRYSVLCSLIFQQVSSSECIHLNVLNVLKKVLYKKVREHNEQLANELLAQNFNFAATGSSDIAEPIRNTEKIQAQTFNFATSVLTDTTESKRNEVNDSGNTSILNDSSVNAIGTFFDDNSILASQDIASMHVSNNSVVDESQNLNKSIEKAVQTETQNVISLLGDTDESSNSNQSNDARSRSKENPQIDSTELFALTSLPSRSKTSDVVPIENNTDVITPRNTCTVVNTKTKSKTNAVNNQQCKSKLKNIAHSKPAILPNTKADETKESDDLHTPPEAEKSSRISQTLFDNLTLNPHYRRDSYITPLKKRRGNVFGHTILHVNNNQDNDSSLIYRIDDFQSSQRRVLVNSLQPAQPVADSNPVEVVSQEKQTSKMIPNILKPSNKSDPSKTRLPKNTPPNQGKPSLVRKPKPDSKKAPMKPASKAASTNDKRMHLVIPNILPNEGISPPVHKQKSDETPANPASKASSSNEKEVQSMAPDPAKLPPVHKLKSDSNESPVKSAPKIISSNDKDRQPVASSIASNQDKLPPVRKQTLNSNDPAMKVASKAAPSVDKEIHLIIPRIHPPDNPHLQRPPPIIDAPWDSNLRIFTSDALENNKSKSTPKSAHKTSRKTPRKQKRESSTDIDEHLKKRPKLDEHTTNRVKKASKRKADNLDKSIENQSKENKGDNVSDTELRLNQLPVAELQAKIQPSSQPQETPNMKSTSAPLPAKNKNDPVKSIGVDIIGNILRAAADNVAKSQPIPIIPPVDGIINEESEDGMNLTLENEVVLYEANLQFV